MNNEKLQHFAQLLESDRVHELTELGLSCAANVTNCKVKVIPGRKYTRVDVGASGNFMVDEDGNIFGIKAYGVIHKGHRYGTLDTVDNYYWGQYRGYCKRAGKHPTELLTVETALEKGQ